MGNKLKVFFNKITENSKYRIMFFLCIILICVVALCIGIYVQFYYRYSEADPLMLGIQLGADEETENINKLKNEFYDLFENKFVYNDDINEKSVVKKQESKDIVYTGYDLQNEDENFYQIDVNVPILNINSEKAEEINNEIKTEFYETANSIMRKMSGHTVYNVNYTAYLYQDVISIVIKASLKEEGKNEKVSIKTFNYSIDKNEDVRLSELIEKTENIEKKVQSKIEEEIKRYNKNSLAVAEEYGSTYTRNLEDNMYKIENTEEYFITNSGKLYIIYPYGNIEYTNEVDIIIF